MEEHKMSISVVHKVFAVSKKAKERCFRRPTMRELTSEPNKEPNEQPSYMIDAGILEQDIRMSSVILP